MPAHTPVQPVQPPSEEEIRTRLGRAFPLFHALVDDADLRPEWKFYGPKYGWSLKVFEKKRNLCFISPKERAFSVGFIFGDRARDEALAGPAPEAIKALLRDARHYPEGWGVTLTVGKKAELAQAQRLLALKRAS